MDCKTTSIKHQRSGIALVDYLVSTALASIVFLAISIIVIFSGRSFAALANYVNLDQHSRNALDVMSRQIRQANRLTAFTTNALTFEDSDGGTLQFNFDASARTLTRTKNGTRDARPLLEECDFLKFSIFQRNPVAGTYDQYPTATATNCKLVQLNWICSRKVLGAKLNTESVQSAKVVIRKE